MRSDDSKLMRQEGIKGASGDWLGILRTYLPADMVWIFTDHGPRLTLSVRIFTYNSPRLVYWAGKLV